MKLNERSILFILLTVITISLAATIVMNYSFKKEIDNLKTEIQTLKIEKDEASLMDQKTIDALLTFYQDYENVITVYDNNVEIYNKSFIDHETRLLNIEDSLEAIIKYLTK